MFLAKHQALFIHVPKTGGSSIKRYFESQHISVRKYKAELATNWNDLFKFAFVRNPWDRYVSMFHYRKTTHEPELNLDIEKVSFNEWLLELFNLYQEKISRNVTLGRSGFVGNQYDYLIDVEENLCVDFIGRFENFTSDFQKICQKIKEPIRPLPHLKKTQHEPYYTYYSEEAKQAVQKMCWKDIEIFGYQFQNNGNHEELPRQFS